MGTTEAGALGAQRSMDAGVRELASGVDALYLSADVELSAALLAAVHDHKERARSHGSVSLIEVAGEEFGVAASGFNRYAYCLRHEHMWIGLTGSAHLPGVYVQLRASFLHAVGVQAAVEKATRVLEALAGCSVPWTVSRVDLFADVQGWDLSGDDRAAFVCRSKALTTFEVDNVFSGFLFGKRNSGTVIGRIYDKTMKIAEDGDRWWFDKWGSRYRSGERVLRVEFEFHREVLKQCQLSSVEETLCNLDRLWAYATDRWLSLRVQGSDSTRSRWRLSEVWTAVQRSELRGDAIGIERVYAGASAGSLARLLPALRGYMASAGAALGCLSVSDVADAVAAALIHDQARTGVDFESRVLAKARRARFA